MPEVVHYEYFHCSVINRSQALHNVTCHQGARLNIWVYLYSKVMKLLRTKLRSAAAAAKSLQSCPTLCDPRDGSPPGSPVPGILQARTLEWVAISFSMYLNL